MAASILSVSAAAEDLLIEIHPSNDASVTAQHRRERVRDVPVSMEVFSGQQLEADRIHDTPDIIAATPSVNFTPVGGNLRNTNFSVRGIGSMVLGAGVDSSVAVYVDDVFIGNGASHNAELFDIERVEVMRGPQGTLYGKNALAGAIHIHTAPPTAKTAALGEVSYGNYNYVNGRGYVNGAFDDDGLVGRLSATVTRRNGTEHNISAENVNTQDNWALRTQVAGANANGFSLRVIGDYARDRAIRTAGGDFTTATEYSDVSDPYHQQRDIFGLTGKATWEGKDATLVSITGLRTLQFANPGSDLRPQNYFRQGQYDRQRQLSEEVRLISPQDQRLRWLSGVFLYGETWSTKTFRQLFDVAPLWGLSYGHREQSTADQSSASGAVFGDFTWGVTDQWDIGGGMRYSRETKSIDYHHTANDGVSAMGRLQTLKQHREFDDLSPRLVTTYTWSDNAKTYAKIERGFKSGGFSNLAANSTHLGFDAETGWNYEMGAKTNWLGDRATLNVSVFQMDVKNQQVQVLYPTGGVVTSNASSSVSRGFEVDGTVTPEKHVSLFGRFSYADARFDEYRDAPIQGTIGQTENVSGKRLPFASQYSYDFGLAWYSFVTPWTRLTARAGYQFKGPIYFDVGNRMKQPGYGQINGSLGLDGEGWEVRLWGKNLTDTRYRLWAINEGAQLGISAGPGDPRTFGMTGAVKF
ncbi:MAG: TonB-dependent receptor [Alphaproteobacteria bacterium]|nr:TonB-dependent receptor [Alphaproteobacteria bacterium]